MKKRFKKADLIDWLADFHNNCGHTDYYGEKMTIVEFKKELKEKSLGDLLNNVYYSGAEGKAFICATTIEKLKKGDLFTFPGKAPVYVHDGYNHSTRKYSMHRYDDINAFREVKKGTKVIED